MRGDITYHQQVTRCGKPRCRKCREGIGHGPYWYAYQTINGQVKRQYIGKTLPPDIQARVFSPDASPSSPSTSTLLRMYTLGQFRIERRDPLDPSAWQTVTEAAWQQQRVRDVLGSLVSIPGRRVACEQLMDVFWPKLDVETASSRLEREVYGLRQLFEPGRTHLATSPLLLTEREVVVLAEHPQVWVDADAFEHLVLQAYASDDPGEREYLLERAFMLYGGAFLPEEGEYKWLAARRTTLHRCWIRLLLDLADLRIAHEAFSRAIEPLERLLSVDPTNEAAVQRLVSLLAQLGRRSEALGVYQHLAAILQQQYRVASPELRALYEAVRTGEYGIRVRAVCVPTSTQRVLDGQQEGQEQDCLVGRTQEREHLAAMLTCIEQAIRFRPTAQKRLMARTFDRPQCVLLKGEPGIGKTRLAEEVAWEASVRGWTVISCRSYIEDGRLPYRIWIEVLRQMLTLLTWQRQEISKRPLVFQPLCALLPELHPLLSPVFSPVSLSPEQEHMQVWEAVCELLRLLSESAPVLLILDGLHWLDPRSCELFAYLTRQTRGLAHLILATVRDGERLPPQLIDLQRETEMDTFHLKGLSPEHLSALLARSRLPAPLLNDICHLSAGNPLFALTLAEAAQRGVAEGVAAFCLPEMLIGLLEERLCALSPECRMLLKKLALPGETFQYRAAMLLAAPETSPQRLLALLEEALQARILVEVRLDGREVAAPDIASVQYRFEHPLLAWYLRESLSAGRRAYIAHRLLDSLEPSWK